MLIRDGRQWPMARQDSAVGPDQSTVSVHGTGKPARRNTRIRESHGEGTKMAMFEPREGCHIGGFRVERILAGGFNYALICTRLSPPNDQRVIITPKTNLGDHLELFKRGVSLWLQIPRDIKGIAQCSHIEVDNNPPYAVLQFVDGPTWSDLLKREARRTGVSRLHPCAAGSAAAQMSRALADANLWACAKQKADGLVHRDLHPGNVMVEPGMGSGGDSFGYRWQVRIIDLGLSKLAHTDLSLHSVQALGVRPYVSPEGLNGVGWLTPSSDIYSVGVILYMSLTGTLPFQGWDMDDAQRRGRYEPASKVCSDLPREFDEVIGKCLKADPSERCTDGHQLAAELNALVETLPHPPLACEHCAFPALVGREGEPQTCPVCDGSLKASFSARPGTSGPIGLPPDENEQPKWKPSAKPMSLKWLDVPEGEFVAGLDSKLLTRLPLQESARQRHFRRSVWVRGFQIAETVVTNAQYYEFVRQTGCEMPEHWRAEQDPPYGAGMDDLPVVNVTWHDAMLYCQWAGARLPTGLEWSKAAGWCARSNQMRLYPWGDEFDPRLCNSEPNGAPGPVSVCEYPDGKSPCGALQMAGNVWEWTDAGKAETKSIRGGSFRDDDVTEQMTSLDITYLHGDVAKDEVGFRCARDAEHVIPTGPRTVRVAAGQYSLGLSGVKLRQLVKQLGRADRHRKKLAGRGGALVQVGEFEMATYPVTNLEYWEFVQATDSDHPEHWHDEPWSNITADEPPFWQLIAHWPVANVTLEDARNYCRWKGVRLPTSEEWEVAARGADGLVYPWGDKFEAGYCNDLNEHLGHPCSVTEYARGASPWGALHMVGNVFEWLDDGTIRGGGYNAECDLYGLPHVSLIEVGPRVKRLFIGFRWVNA